MAIENTLYTRQLTYIRDNNTMNQTGRLIVSIKGTTLTPAEREMLKHPMVAGLVLFTDNYVIPANFKDKVQLKDLILDITQSGNKTCFVDHEGGYIQRFGRGFKSLPAVEIFGEIYDLNQDVAKSMAYKYGAIMAEQLMEYGIISLTPMCDVDGGNTVVSRLNRAFHKEPQACIDLLHAYIDGMNSKGMHATGKHYPGHGRSLGDSHLNTVVDSRSLNALEQDDLSVFIEMIKANKLAAIMPAHILYPEVDASFTAGASKIWLQDLLRNKYAFDGVIISDCLSMAGAGAGSLLEKTEQALAFGDVSILCHQDPSVIIELGDQLLEKGYAMDQESQQRYMRWTKTADDARQKFAQQQLATA